MLLTYCAKVTICWLLLMNPVLTDWCRLLHYCTYYWWTLFWLRCIRHTRDEPYALLFCCINVHISDQPYKWSTIYSTYWCPLLYNFTNKGLKLSTLTTYWNIFLIFFPRKLALIFHANCLLRRQFAWNVKSCFLGKIRKISQICCFAEFAKRVVMLTCTYCAFDILWKKIFFYLAFYSKWKNRFLTDNISAETICLFCSCALFSNIYHKINFMAKNGSDFCFSSLILNYGCSTTVQWKFQKSRTSGTCWKPASKLPILSIFTYISAIFIMGKIKIFYFL